MDIKLQPKDGKVHVLYVQIRRTNKSGDIILSNNKIETIVSAIQDKGYEIVDIKFASEGYGYSPYGTVTLIMYK